MSGHFAISKPFPTFLAVTGVLAAIAVVAPSVVLLQFVAGILPGVVLFAAPSVFLYALAWYLVRTGVLLAGTLARFDMAQWPFRVLAGALAVPIVLAAAFLPPRMINPSVDQAVKEFRAEDRGAAQPLAFPPVVAIMLPHSIDKQPPCDTLCQRFLFNGAVTKVVTANSDLRSNSPRGRPILD